MYNKYSPKEKMELGHYLIAYIDILGQREHLQKFKDLPKNEEEERKFKEILKATFGTIDGIRSIFDEYFQANMRKKTEYPGPMTEEQRKLFDDLRGYEIKCQRFADTVVFYLPLASRKGHWLPIQAVYSVLMACASVFVATLAWKRVLRGSIEVGLAAEMCEGEIYGPALFEAYRLESKIAQYPRVVIGDELMNYLRQLVAARATDIVGQITKKSAELCLALISADYDGNHILDYMGPGARQILSPDTRMKEIDMAKVFLFAEAEKWRNLRNTELSSRYALMLGYFLSRLPLWEENTSSG